MDRWELLAIAGTFVSLCIPLFIAYIVSSKQWKAAQHKARARRLADAKMNARLLRLDI